MTKQNAFYVFFIGLKNRTQFMFFYGRKEFF